MTQRPALAPRRVQAAPRGPRSARRTAASLFAWFAGPRSLARVPSPRNPVITVSSLTPRRAHTEMQAHAPVLQKQQYPSDSVATITFWIASSADRTCPYLRNDARAIKLEQKDSEVWRKTELTCHTRGLFCSARSDSASATIASMISLRKSVLCVGPHRMNCHGRKPLWYVAVNAQRQILSSSASSIWPSMNGRDWRARIAFTTLKMNFPFRQPLSVQWCRIHRKRINS